VSVFKEKPAIAAYNFTHMVPILALSYYGVLRLDLLSQQPATLKGRMYMYDEAAEQICIVQIALQLFQVVVAFGTMDSALIKPEALGHHIVTGAVMWFCLHPFGHSYVGVFFGLTELSTVPLDVIDTFKNFKSLRKVYPTTELIAKASFSLSFLILRVALTLKVSYEFQLDLFELYTTGQAHSVPVVIFMSVSNFLVCALQCYWGTLVIKGIGRMFGGGSKKAEKAA
jgi:hypothetical protein